MRALLNGKTLEVVLGDVTRERTDAIVTAANAGLQGGGGVDGAVHRAAGPRLLEACRALGGCATGDAVATPAFDLPVKRVVHAVGPIFGRTSGAGATEGHGSRDDELLASAHRRSLEVAAAEGCRSISFPAISCGAYGFPVARAATVALAALRDALLGETPIVHVRYCLFGEAERKAFVRALVRLAEGDARIELRTT